MFGLRRRFMHKDNDSVQCMSVQQLLYLPRSPPLDSPVTDSIPLSTALMLRTIDGIKSNDGDCIAHLRWGGLEVALIRDADLPEMRKAGTLREDRTMR